DEDCFGYGRGLTSFLLTSAPSSDVAWVEVRFIVERNRCKRYGSTAPFKSYGGGVTNIDQASPMNSYSNSEKLVMSFFNLLDLAGRKYLNKNLCVHSSQLAMTQFGRIMSYLSDISAKEDGKSLRKIVSIGTSILGSYTGTQKSIVGYRVYLGHALIC
ncbi:hypothetical protein CR513_53227, partial [Mucuna pruriens]